MYFVYIIECKDGSLYTGVTTDVTRRFAEHQAGTGAAYTRSRGVRKIVFTERKRNRSSAQKREAQIKSWPRSKKISILKG